MGSRTDGEGRGDSEQGYDYLPRPQRLLVRTLEQANRPFNFVPEPAKDTLGVVAIVTLIVSMLAAIVILFTR